MTVVGLLVDDEGEEPDMSLAASAPAPEAAPTPDALKPSAPTPSPTASAGSAKPLSPAVLALVNLYGLDPSAIPATGPKGHVLKGDVLAFLGDTPPPVVKASSPLPTGATATAAAPTPASGEVAEPEYVDIPVTTMRRVIADRLTESKTTIPHAYTQIDVDVTELLALRKQLIEETGVKFSVNDVIVKASALALRTVPTANAHCVDGEAVPLTTVDIAIAVATDAGLITPIVPAADGQSVFNISSTVKVRSALPLLCSLSRGVTLTTTSGVQELAGRARSGTLMPHEYQGGSFT